MPWTLRIWNMPTALTLFLITVYNNSLFSCPHINEDPVNKNRDKKKRPPPPAETIKLALQLTVSPEMIGHGGGALTLRGYVRDFRRACRSFPSQPEQTMDLWRLYTINTQHGSKKGRNDLVCFAKYFKGRRLRVNEVSTGSARGGSVQRLTSQARATMWR